MIEVMTDSPAAARRRLRLAIRNAREAKRLTQGEVAEELEWSLSKVSRIENGEVSVSGTDLRALLALFEITDSAEVDELTRYGRAARKRGWWDEARYRAHLTPAYLKLIQYESEASVIRCFQPTLFPGVLQTPDYARTILDFWNEIPADGREVLWEVRTRRREQLFDLPNEPPAYLVILDGSVLMREVGRPGVLARQIEAVLEMLAKPGLAVRIVPIATSAPISQLGGFMICDLDGEEDAILYWESAFGDNIVETSGTISRYRHVFEQMWEQALTLEESAELLRKRLRDV
jgi:transcriptional regulator with XRE-family HTH domain